MSLRKFITGLSRLIVTVTLLSLGVRCWASQDLDRGLNALRDGQPEVAVQLWTRVIESNPNSYAAHVNRGSALMTTGHVLMGIRDWHKARGLSPLFAYGVFTGDFVRQGSGDPSVLSFAAALELDPDHVASVVMMGITYLDLGLTDEAVELYRKSIDLTKNPLLKSYLDHWIESIGQ
ncbi:MAG: tetratricopeptide repeat protein [Deltaproteobacteria bacterium]|nr:tetratricopeptide repeat protein [Deltaproteobacteria bacterium]